jgi:hypothetical protein
MQVEVEHRLSWSAQYFACPGRLALICLNEVGAKVGTGGKRGAHASRGWRLTFETTFLIQASVWLTATCGVVSKAKFEKSSSHF